MVRPSPPRSHGSATPQPCDCSWAPRSPCSQPLHSVLPKQGRGSLPAAFSRMNLCRFRWFIIYFWVSLSPKVHWGCWKPFSLCCHYSYIHIYFRQKYLAIIHLISFVFTNYYIFCTNLTLLRRNTFDYKTDWVGSCSLESNFKVISRLYFITPRTSDLMTLFQNIKLNIFWLLSNPKWKKGFCPHSFCDQLAQQEDKTFIRTTEHHILFPPLNHGTMKTHDNADIWLNMSSHFFRSKFSFSNVHLCRAHGASFTQNRLQAGFLILEPNSIQKHAATQGLRAGFGPKFLHKHTAKGAWFMRVWQRVASNKV